METVENELKTMKKYCNKLMCMLDMDCGKHCFRCPEIIQ